MMAVTSIIAFGKAREDVHSWGKSVQSECKKHGADVKGPMPLPQISISYDGEDHHIRPANVEDSDENWFSRIHLSEKEKDELFPKPRERKSIIFGRALEIEADDAAASVLDTELDGEFFLRVSVEKNEIPDNPGSHNHGYDPNKDYVTDIDYNANHR